MTGTGTRTGGEPGVAALPSPPTDRELAILQRVLEAEAVPGVEQLLAQLRMLQVAPVSDATCRIYLLHVDAPRSTFARDGRSPLPTRFPVRTPGGRVAGEVVVWVQHGHLCALQYVAEGPSDAMVLPPPEWIELPEPAVSIAISVRAARQALLGVQAISAAPAAEPGPTVESSVRQPRHRRAAMVAAAILAILAVAALATAAFLAASARGVDVEGPRAAGATAGAALGAEHGEVAGRFAGDVEGRVAGRNLAYPPAFVRARDREQAEIRRDDAERRRADAAAVAAAAAPPPAAVPIADSTTCAGYRDANGFWVCA